MHHCFHTHTCTHTQTNTHTHTHKHTHTHTYTCTHVRSHACTHTFYYCSLLPFTPASVEGSNKARLPCLSLASLWMVPHLWFIFFISASTVLRQVVFGRPHFRFPSRVQWIATLVMELASLRSTCPIQRHRFLVMMVSMSSCWHHAKRSQLEVVLGQKMGWIFLRLVV